MPTKCSVKSESFPSRVRSGGGCKARHPIFPRESQWGSAPKTIGESRFESVREGQGLQPSRARCDVCTYPSSLEPCIGLPVHEETMP